MKKQEALNRIEAQKETIIELTGWAVFRYIEALLEQIDEPQKVVVPQFVADWIKYCKEHNFTLLGCLDPVDDFGMSLSEGFKGDTRKCIKWCRKESNTFARAWLDGYEVEKEKRYFVRLKNVDENYNYLTNIKHLNAWALTEIKRDKKFRTEHTRKELEEGGFGEVFDSPLFEIEEVEE